MTDLKRLRELYDAATRKRPWSAERNVDNAAALYQAVVEALPALLAVVEAADHLRDREDCGMGCGTDLGPIFAAVDAPERQRVMGDTLRKRQARRRTRDAKIRRETVTGIVAMIREYAHANRADLDELELRELARMIEEKPSWSWAAPKDGGTWGAAKAMADIRAAKAERAADAAVARAEAAESAEADAVVHQVGGDIPGEIDVFHDGHSHHYVPTSAWREERERAEALAELLRIYE